MEFDYIRNYFCVTMTHLWMPQTLRHWHYVFLLAVCHNTNPALLWTNVVFVEWVLNHKWTMWHQPDLCKSSCLMVKLLFLLTGWLQVLEVTMQFKNSQISINFLHCLNILYGYTKRQE
jgi:hypothetical protein